MCHCTGHSIIDAAFAFRIEGVINHELSRKNVRVAQAELAETMRNPAKPFACRMWTARMRIRCPNYFTKQEKSWIIQLVFFEDRIERYVFAVMAELAARHVVNDSAGE